jgi:hypothetical protein
MLLPIGVSNFRELIEYKDPISGEKLLYVDKSLFIKEILSDSSKVIVLTRPRRFGKTLNLTMLQYFFAAEVTGQATKGLFDNLNISIDPKCMEYQGKFPVVFISFKDIKQPNFELCLASIANVMAAVYRNHRTALELANIPEDDLEYIKLILQEKANRIQLEGAIKRLLELLFKYYQEKPILLIDEYDTPLQEAYLNNYYDQLIAFFRNFLSQPLKDYNLLNRGVLTGILRVSKESLFSGLSNIEIYSVFNKNYASYFGFTENEVNNLLTRAKLSMDSGLIKKWYNGYNFSGTTIYNPWSIIKCIKENGSLRSYWINTSGNTLVKQLIVESSYNLQESIAKLINNKTIQTNIDEHIVFNDLNKTPESIWSLLLMSGYLKYNSCENKGRFYLCELSIPNNEIEDFYASTVETWLTGNRGLSWYQAFLNSLTKGLIIEFEEKLQTLINETLSFYDVTKKSQECFYHALLLGLTASLKNTHYIASNKEAGLGRYDLEITPKDPKELGIIIEIKVANDLLTLEEEANVVLEQITKLNYIANLRKNGINNICQIGIACFGKSIKIISKTNLVEK